MDRVPCTQPPVSSWLLFLGLLESDVSHEQSPTVESVVIETHFHHVHERLALSRRLHSGNYGMAMTGSQ